MFTFMGFEPVHNGKRMDYADIARVDLLLLNIKLIMNKPIKHLQIVWASITEKKTYMRTDTF